MVGGEASFPQEELLVAVEVEGGQTICNIFNHLKSKIFLLLLFIWSLQVILSFNISCASLCTCFFNEYDWITTPLNLRVFFLDPNRRDNYCLAIIWNSGASTHDPTIFRGYLSFTLPFPTVTFTLLLYITSCLRRRKASCG